VRDAKFRLGLFICSATSLTGKGTVQQGGVLTLSLVFVGVSLQEQFAALKYFEIRSMPQLEQ
jgi:hypothetical protein